MGGDAFLFFLFFFSKSIFLMFVYHIFFFFISSLSYPLFLFSFRCFALFLNESAVYGEPFGLFAYKTCFKLISESSERHSGMQLIDLGDLTVEKFTRERLCWVSFSGWDDTQSRQYMIKMRNLNV